MRYPTRKVSVFFTLALGAAMIWVFELVEKKYRTKKWFIDIPVLLLFMLISEPCYYFAFGATPTPSGFLRNLSRLHFTNVFFTPAHIALILYLSSLITPIEV